MRNIVVRGGRKLEGRIEVQGAKNSVLPILAATVLGQGKSTIHACPDLSDVRYSIKILEHLGCKVKRDADAVEIDPSGIRCGEIPDLLMNRMRSSITFLGALTARCKRAKMSFPGGCELGSRPIDLHIKALKELGVGIKEYGGVIESFGENITGAKIHLDFPSVGATENIMLAAATARGITEINNAAKEPEIVDLQNFLCKMGAKISGAGTGTIIIEGVEVLKGASHKVIPDRIVAATYLCAGMICGGDITLSNIKDEHICSIESVLCDMGAEITHNNGEIRLRSSGKTKSIEMIRTLPYPGFPTDAQSLFTAALATADGVSVVTENIFDNRFRYCAELAKMGADIRISGKTAIIRGVKKMYGAPVNAMDLRGGAALCIGALGAEGITQISGVEYIERGYESITEDLKNMGADIKII